jgi:hypothetical protein
MKNTRHSASFVTRLVRQHGRGTTPASGTLDSKKKVSEYVERMREATEDRLREDRRARQDSAARASTRPID